MKVMFIYIDNTSSVGYSAGIGVLSAILKKEGHQTALQHISDELDYPLDQDRINKGIYDYQPKLICFSITTNQWRTVTQVGTGIKKELNIPIMVGGPHPSGDPDAVMEEPWVDFLCRGEGDIALPETVRCFEAGLPYEGVPNLMYRKNGVVVKEPLGKFVEDLDSLPLEDREIFDYERIIETRHGWAEVIVTRGCPYPCSHCFNETLFNQYRNDEPKYAGTSLKKKEFVRRLSVSSTLSMLNRLIGRYPQIIRFTFVDDILATDGVWFAEFSKRYKNEIGLPYACTSHPLVFNARVAKLLKESGCKVVKMGVESGNMEIRSKVLKRDIKDQHLVDVFRIAKESGLKPQSFNMIGIPGESIEQMMDTVRLNARIKPYIVWLSTFIPYPGSLLYDECRKKGMIDEDKWTEVVSYREESPLKDAFLPRRAFRKIRVMFRWHLNSCLGNSAASIYKDAIRDLSSLPNEQWEIGEIDKVFTKRDDEIDAYLRQKDISHYMRKKYVNIFWGSEYDYDIT